LTGTRGSLIRWLIGPTSFVLLIRRSSSSPFPAARRPPIFIFLMLRTERPSADTFSGASYLSVKCHSRQPWCLPRLPSLPPSTSCRPFGLLNPPNVAQPLVAYHSAMSSRRNASRCQLLHRCDWSAALTSQAVAAMFAESWGWRHVQSWLRQAFLSATVSPLLLHSGAGYLHLSPAADSCIPASSEVARASIVHPSRALRGRFRTSLDGM
jgi:hypothetical protein